MNFVVTLAARRGGILYLKTICEDKNGVAKGIRHTTEKSEAIRFSEPTADGWVSRLNKAGYRASKETV